MSEFISNPTRTNRTRFTCFQRLTLVLVLVVSLPSFVIADATTDYNLAVQFYKQERWKLAAEACEEFIKNYPEHVQAPTAQLYWGQSLVHLRDFKNAREKFKSYLADPRAKADRALAMYRVGESSYFLGDFASAVGELSTFLKGYQDHELAVWANVYHAQSQFQLGKMEEAIQSFELSLKRYEENPLKAEAQYGLARAYETGGNSAKAVQIYEEILETAGHSQHANALFHLAAIRFSSGEYENAANLFQRFTKQYPEDRLASLAALNAGYASYQQKAFSQAIEQFEAASEDENQKQTAQYWIGLSYKSLGDYSRAVEVFQKSLREDQKQPLAQNLAFQAGDAELRLKNYEKAQQYFAYTYENFPQGDYADDALHSACEAAMQQGNLERAAELHEVFEEKYPRSGLGQLQNLLYGRVLIGLGDQAQQVSSGGSVAFFAKAAETLNEVVDSSTVEETQNYARFQLARAYERIGDEEKLIATLEPVLSKQETLDQIAVEGLLLLANAKLRKQQFSEAQRDYSRLLDVVEQTDTKRSVVAGYLSTLIAAHEWEKVQEQLAALEKIDPQDRHLSRLSLAAGDTAFELKKFKVAENFFRQGVRRQAGNSYLLASLSGLGHSLYQQNNYAAAAFEFQRLADMSLQDDKLRSHAYYMTGMSFQQAEDAKQAIKAYKTGLEEFQSGVEDQIPEVKETLYQIAKAAARTSRDQQELEAADGYYKQAFDFLQIVPERAEAELDKFVFEWADMHYNAEDYPRADELYAKLIKLSPESSLADDAGLILAESDRFSGQIKDALAKFRKLAESATSDVFIKKRALVHLVDLNAEQQNWQQVLQDVKLLESLDSDAEHQLYLDYRKAEASLQTQQIDQATLLLQDLRQRLLEMDQNRPAWWEEVWLLQSEAALLRKEYDQLNALADEIRSQTPDSKVIPRVDVLVGRGLENQAKFDEARVAYQRSIDSKVGQGTLAAAEAQFRLAESYLKQNNYEQALKEYYKVYAGYDAPGYESAALFQAARSDAKLKNWKGAVQTFSLLLEEFPESEYTKQAQQQLKEIEAAFPELKKDDQ